MKEMLEIEQEHYKKLLQQEPTFKNQLLIRCIEKEIKKLERRIEYEKERANKIDKHKSPNGFIRNILKDLYRLWNIAYGRDYTLSQLSKETNRKKEGATT